jgi:hypothetical protein
MMRRLWKWFLARFRLSQKAVCEMSQGCGLFDDYHDYPDDGGLPCHFVLMRCKFCGKEFMI